MIDKDSIMKFMVKDNCLKYSSNARVNVLIISHTIVSKQNTLLFYPTKYGDYISLSAVFFDFVFKCIL